LVVADVFDADSYVSMHFKLALMVQNVVSYGSQSIFSTSGKRSIKNKNARVARKKWKHYKELLPIIPP
jgi:hypothetical protein